jgi:predicted TIM-barrel fold metal-dependent hydrolase
MEARYRKVISADSHVREPVDLWSNALGKKFGERTPRLLHEHKGRPGRFFYTGLRGHDACRIGDIEAEQKDRIDEELARAGYDPAARVKFQERAHIEAEVLNPTVMTAIMQSQYLDVVRASAQVFNDWMAELSSYDPRRLLGVGVVPLDDVEWAVNELQRIRKKNIRSVMIHTDAPTSYPPYRDRVYDPFWAAAQDLDVPITLHIITGRVVDPLLYFTTPKEHEESPRALLDLFYEVMGPLANEFIFGQIFDRFPRLKLICSEFEISWIPTFMYRLDQMQSALSALMPLPKLKLAASDYMRTRVWHGTIDDPYARDVIPRIGVDQIMWGSDFPHIRSIGLEAHDTLSRLFEGVPPRDVEKIVGGNVAKVFGL